MAPRDSHASPSSSRSPSLPPLRTSPPPEHHRVHLILDPYVDDNGKPWTPSKAGVVDAWPDRPRTARLGDGFKRVTEKEELGSKGSKGREREKAYDMNLIDTKGMNEYDPLFDEYLGDYFGSRGVRRHLLKLGLIDEQGNAISPRTFKHNQIRLERKKYYKSIQKQAQDRDFDRALEVTIRNHLIRNPAPRSTKLVHLHSNQNRNHPVNKKKLPYPSFLAAYPPNLTHTALLYATKPRGQTTAREMLVHRLRSQPGKLQALGLDEGILEELGKKAERDATAGRVREWKKERGKKYSVKDSDDRDRDGGKHGKVMVHDDLSGEEWEGCEGHDVSTSTSVGAAKLQKEEDDDKDSVEKLFKTAEQDYRDGLLEAVSKDAKGILRRVGTDGAPDGSKSDLKEKTKSIPKGLFAEEADSATTQQPKKEPEAEPIPPQSIPKSGRSTTPGTPRRRTARPKSARPTRTSHFPIATESDFSFSEAGYESSSPSEDDELFIGDEIVEDGAGVIAREVGLGEGDVEEVLEETRVGGVGVGGDNEKKEKGEVGERKRRESAVKVQSLFRGYLVRKELEELAKSRTDLAQGKENQQDGDRYEDEFEQEGDGGQDQSVAGSRADLGDAEGKQHQQDGADYENEFAQEGDVETPQSTGQSRTNLAPEKQQDMDKYEDEFDQEEDVEPPQSAVENDPTDGGDDKYQDDFISPVTEPEPDTEERKRRTSATKVQSLYRGYKIRKQLEDMAKSQPDLSKQSRNGNQQPVQKNRDTNVARSATKVQSLYRGYRIRKELEDLARSRTDLSQSKPNRGEKAKSNAELHRDDLDRNLDQSATKVQSLFRGYKIRKELEDLARSRTELSGQSRGDVSKSQSKLVGSSGGLNKEKTKSEGMLLKGIKALSGKLGRSMTSLDKGGSSGSTKSSNGNLGQRSKTGSHVVLSQPKTGSNVRLSQPKSNSVDGMGKSKSLTLAADVALPESMPDLSQTDGQSSSNLSQKLAARSMEQLAKTKSVDGMGKAKSLTLAAEVALPKSTPDLHQSSAQSNADIRQKSKSNSIDQLAKTKSVEGMEKTKSVTLAAAVARPESTSDLRGQGNIDIHQKSKSKSIEQLAKAKSLEQLAKAKSTQQMEKSKSVTLAAAAVALPESTPDLHSQSTADMTKSKSKSKSITFAASVPLPQSTVDIRSNGSTADIRKTQNTADMTKTKSKSKSMTDIMVAASVPLPQSTVDIRTDDSKSNKGSMVDIRQTKSTADMTKSKSKSKSTTDIMNAASIPLPQSTVDIRTDDSACTSKSNKGSTIDIRNTQSEVQTGMDIRSDKTGGSDVSVAASVVVSESVVGSKMDVNKSAAASKLDVNKNESERDLMRSGTDLRRLDNVAETKSGVVDLNTDGDMRKVMNVDLAASVPLPQSVVDLREGRQQSLGDMRKVGSVDLAASVALPSTAVQSVVDLREESQSGGNIRKGSVNLAASVPLPQSVVDLREGTESLGDMGKVGSVDLAASVALPATAMQSMVDLRKAESVNLAASVPLPQSVADLRKVGSVDLAASVPSTVDLRKTGSINLAASVPLPQSMVDIRKVGSVDLANKTQSVVNMTKSKTGSVDLAASVPLPQSMVDIRKSDVDMDAENGSESTKSKSASERNLAGDNAGSRSSLAIRRTASGVLENRNSKSLENVQSTGQNKQTTASRGGSTTDLSDKRASSTIVEHHQETIGKSASRGGSKIDLSEGRIPTPPNTSKPPNTRPSRPGSGAPSTNVSTGSLDFGAYLQAAGVKIVDKDEKDGTTGGRSGITPRMGSRTGSVEVGPSVSIVQG